VNLPLFSSFAVVAGSGSSLIFQFWGSEETEICRRGIAELKKMRRNSRKRYRRTEKNGKKSQKEVPQNRKKREEGSEQGSSG